jgi:Undecaprenyl-phosphate galactose phosphotransferase WbaP
VALVAALAMTGSLDDVGRAWSPPLGYVVLAWPFFAGLAGLYPGYGLAHADELARTVRASAAAGLTFAVIATAFPLGPVLAPSAALLVIPIALVTSPMLRWATKWVLRQALVWGRPVVVIGTGSTAISVTNYLARNPGIGLKPVAIFGDAPKGADTEAFPPHRGSFDDAWDFLDAHSIRHVIVSPAAAVTLGYDQILRRADRRVRYVQFLPDLHGLPASSVVATPLGLTLGLEVRNQLASGANRAVKRAFDVVGSTALLAVLAPVLAMIAVLIRIDSPGPSLHLSPRLGRYGRPFRCVKFRTMHIDAEARLQKLLRHEPAVREEYRRYHKLAKDPRITRLGALLRRLSLDELPQLLNVVIGQMSLVGPRPYLVRERADLGPDSDLIFLARPGMTGYWQVDGRNGVSFVERQAMEADYVRNWSVWWDLELLLRTVGVVLRRTGR